MPRGQGDAALSELFLEQEKKKQCELIGRIFPDQMWVERIPPLGHLVPHAALGRGKETTGFPKNLP